MDQVLQSLNVHVHTAQRGILGTEWRCDGLMDPFGRLYFIESGRGFVHHHGRRYELSARRYYLIPANTMLALGCDKRVVIRWCHFTATVLGGIDLFAYLSCEYEILPQEPKHISNLFARFIRIYGSGAPGEEVETRGILLQLLTPFIATATTVERERARARVIAFRQALEYVDTHIEEPIRVPELADVVSYQTAYFSRQFKKAFGIGPARYILRKKIEAAQRLLIETDGTLEFIADRLAFTDAFHLSKTFKRVTGASPSEFRASRAVRMP